MTVLAAIIGKNILAARAKDGKHPPRRQLLGNPASWIRRWAIDNAAGRTTTTGYDPGVDFNLRWERLAKLERAF